MPSSEPELTRPGAAGVVLEVATGPATGRQIPLADEPLVIGRHEPGPGGLGEDPELSRRHARIFRSSGSLAVEDLESTNGTFVNGHRIVYLTEVQAGDVIAVGGSAIKVAAAPPSPRSRASELSASAIHRLRRAETGLLARFAGLATRRPKQILAGTAAFFVLCVAVGAPVVGLLQGTPKPDPDVESSLAENRLEQASGTQNGIGLIALVQAGAPVESAATRAKVRRVTRALERDKHVADVVDFYTTQNRAFVSKDGNSTYVGAVFKNADDAELEDAAADLRDELDKQRGVIVGGSLLVGQTVGEIVGEDLAKAEQLAFPILFIVSLFVFRSLVAAFLPLLVGVITIFATFLTIRVINGLVTDVSVFALNMVIALGLGLAIDYSLFIVSRYREEVARAGYGRDAITRTLQTAGRTVIFSALTVAAALASLLVFPQSIIYSLGLGGAACSLAAVVVSLVVLPSVLTLLGPRIETGSLARFGLKRPGAGEETRGFWYRLSRLVMRRPVPVALATMALLIALGLPFLRIAFTGVDATVLPKDTAVRAVDLALQRDFPSNQGRRITLAIEAPASTRADVERYAESLRGLPAVAAVQPPEARGKKLWELGVVPRFSELDERTLAIVDQVRERAAPFPVSVSGTAAAFIDEKASIRDHLPLALALLAITTIVILFILTGSLVLPIKSLIINLLTVSSAFGLLVLIFQDGRFETLLAYDSQGGIQLSQPLLLFAIAFGLSTDYAVFLLTRIKEARDNEGVSEEEAVAIGLERTGRIVTAAALLFCIAVGAFATSRIVFAKQLGIGTAFAVLVDATIVRALLVPSLMAMLGRRNWWAPRPLRRLHDRIGLSED